MALFQRFHPTLFPKQYRLHRYQTPQQMKNQTRQGSETMSVLDKKNARHHMTCRPSKCGHKVKEMSQVNIQKTA